MKLPQPLPDPLRHGPFTTLEALANEVDPNRLRTSNIQHPFQGVHVADSRELALYDRCVALKKRLPHEAWFCGTTAAQLLGVPLPSRMRKELDLHVAVPRTAQVVPTGRGIKGHIFDIRDGDTATWRSLALSSAERVFCELASRLTVVDLVAAGDFLIHHQQPLTTTVRLSAAVGLFRGRRGLRTMRAALPLLDERSESPQESKLRVILLRGGVSTIANFPIRTSGGFSYRVDLAIPELRVVIEYQSDEFHSDPIARRRDMTRRARLEADGWFVMELNADDLANPSELIERLRRVIESRQRGY